MNDKLLALELESLKDGLLFSGRFYKKPIVIFNSACQCGFTRQLEDFQRLYEEGKIIPIALPTNEFNNQEPGDNYEIIQFCRTQYNITFPVCKKTNLTHKLFQTFGLPDWNFNKYLFDSNHDFIKKFDAYFDPKELLKHV
jgi:glutathione peroxidase